MKRADIESFIKNMDLFSGLNNQELSVLAESLKKESYKPGDLLFEENKPRKDLFIIYEGQVELFKIWKQVNKLDKDVLLFTHFKFKEPQGMPIEELLVNYGLNNSTSIAFFNEVAYGKSSSNQVSLECLNTLYNAADCYINLSSEGYGLPIIEAMATKTPCILLRHSAPSEIGGQGRAPSRRNLSVGRRE